MIELASALKTSSEAIGLVSALAKLIKDSKNSAANNDQKTPLSELLHRLQIEAVRLSRDLENRLRLLSAGVHEYGLNPAKSLNQQLDELFWYNFVTRSRLKTLREECYSISRELTSFLDDATAMLICQSQQQLAANSFKASLESKRDIDRLFADPTTSIGTLIDGLLATASRVTVELLAA